MVKVEGLKEGGVGIACAGPLRWVLGIWGRRGRSNSLEGKGTSSPRLQSVAEGPGVFILQKTWRGG